MFHNPSPSSTGHHFVLTQLLVVVYLSTHIRIVKCMKVVSSGCLQWKTKSSGKSDFYKNKDSHYTLLMEEDYGRLYRRLKMLSLAAKTYSDKDARHCYIMQRMPGVD